MESTPLKPLIFLLLTLLFHHLSPSSATTLPTEALPTKSGYLTVNSTTKSAIFYTFYEAQNPTNTSLRETPHVIWLQGGPGCSSMTGNFYELGPFRVTPSLTHKVEHLVLEPNPGSWNQIFGLLFLDKLHFSSFMFVLDCNG
ncbi:putative carboxypeptidase C [Helianthus annuus]|nr:putative carboxypeptidase C [Helianthus annuus]KAJ0455158.1 putative carboxypeptidase C [Helianthus annuus]KAJ0472708.1 putative carboxypeptidase C [Helianthus annuus]KAJ0648312.1 putative carboxypeptidase C [Helianthus annuus]KAJ0652149.1 putative carboxypeptidase C [Helianthus annuus]